MLELFLNLIDSEEDKTKFEIIYRRYRGFMLKVARMYTDSDYDAEDALQNAFLSIININLILFSTLLHILAQNIHFTASSINIKPSPNDLE